MLLTAAQALYLEKNGKAEADELGLFVEEDGFIMPCGTCARILG